MAGDGHNIDTNPAPKELQKPLFCLGNFFKWLPCSVSQLRRIKNISERKRDEEGKQAWECSLSLTLVVNGLGWGALECSKRSQEKPFLFPLIPCSGWVLGLCWARGGSWTLPCCCCLSLGMFSSSPSGRTDRQTWGGSTPQHPTMGNHPFVCQILMQRLP